MATVDEDTTICPEDRSRWINNESQKEYIVLGPQQAKYNSDWHDGVAYESAENGKRYWRATREFYRAFSEKKEP